MSQIISTILFNGQFWIAIIEKYDDDGSLCIGKYTFGPEPNNTDLVDFYLNKYEHIRFHRSELKVRIKKKYSKKELDRNCKKSFENYKIEQKKYLIENKRNRKIKDRESRIENFQLKTEKKKKKKRGH